MPTNLYTIRSFGNNSALLTDGYDLYYQNDQSGAVYTNITNNILPTDNIYNVNSSTDGIMHLKVKNGNIYFTSSLSGNTIIINKLTDYPYINKREQYSFDRIVKDVNCKYPTLDVPVYIFKSDRLMLASNGTNLISIDATGTQVYMTHNISNITASISRNLELTYKTTLICKINNGINNTYIPLYTGDTTGLTTSTPAIYGTTIDNPSEPIGSQLISIVVNNKICYIKTFTSDIDNSTSSNIIGTYSTGSFISNGFVLININDTENLFMEIFTKDRFN